MPSSRSCRNAGRRSSTASRGTPATARGMQADRSAWRSRGSSALPFEHDDVRVYIDNLFVEGMLTAVPHEAGDALRGTWAAVGIRFDPEADRLRRLEGLMGAVGASIPGPDARHHEWTAFACRWAELEVLRLGTALEVAAPAWCRRLAPRRGRGLAIRRGRSLALRRGRSLALRCGRGLAPWRGRGLAPRRSPKLALRRDRLPASPHRRRLAFQRGPRLTP